MKHESFAMISRLVSQMGIASVRTFFRGNHTKITLLLSGLVLLTATTISAFIVPAPTVSAAVSNCGWVNDKIIKCTSDGREVDFVDSNPNDTNRTFKSEVAPDWCTNKDMIDTITVGVSPAGATLYDMITPEPQGAGDVGDVVAPEDCKMQSSTISLSGLAAADNATTVCNTVACIEDLKDGNAAFAATCDPNNPAGKSSSLCTPTPAPPYAEDPNANPTQNADGKEPDPCDAMGNDFSLRWITCPILMAGMGLTDALDGLIEESLHYDTNLFNETTDQGKGFREAWGSFRSIALVLVLIAGLIMVISQGSGLDFVDAYTIRKVLPRLLIAVIGITLSWELLGFIITFFNDIGHWIQDIILLPFQTAAGGGDDETILEGVGYFFSSLVAGLMAVGGAALYGVAIGPLGLLSLLGTVVLALFVGWLVLIIRSVIITVLIIFAPLAFACYILPNTKKVWDFWQNALVTMLMIFPIIMALIAAGKALSIVTDNGFMKIIFMIIPYFFIPFAFKLAGGLMSTLFSLVNDKGRGGFDRLRNFRDNQRKQRFDDAINGRTNNFVARTRMGDVARRFQNANNGGLSPFAAGRARYASTQSRIIQAAAHKAQENDHGIAAADDSSMALLQRKNMTRAQFIKEWADGHQDFMQSKMQISVDRATAEKRAAEALGTAEAGFGARLGTDTMRVAAWKSLVGSSTSYTRQKKNGKLEGEEEAYNRMFSDAGQLMSEGLLSTSDAISAIKANKGRTDLSGIGSSALVATLTEAARIKAADRTGDARVVNFEHARALKNDVLTGTPGGAIIGARHEAIDSLAPEMLRQLEEAYADAYIKPQPFDKPEVQKANVEAYRRKLAELAGKFDVMQQISPQSAEKFRSQVLSQKITHEGATAWEQMEDSRVTDAFREMRREYAQREADAYRTQQQTEAAREAFARQQNGGGPPGGIPPIPGLPQ